MSSAGSGGIAELTRRAWYLGIRHRQLSVAHARCGNRLLRQRLQAELIQMGAQFSTLQTLTEGLASTCGPDHWELPLLLEVMRRSIGSGVAGAV